MSHVERFQAYADAFEKTYLDDDWQRLEEYFTPDATYAPGDGSKAVGRDQVIAQLRDGVNGLDRRFDSRALSASPPSLEGDTVSLAWKLTLSKQGAPEFTATGIERATFAGSAISCMEDVFDEGVVEALGAWMAAHGESLGA
ncbi:MAG: nuclear transport factor 2 family protein [Pseudomonadales bacterium]|jgi:hypothetical protein